MQFPGQILGKLSTVDRNPPATLHDLQNAMSLTSVQPAFEALLSNVCFVVALKFVVMRSIEEAFAGNR